MAVYQKTSVREVAVMQAITERGPQSVAALSTAMGGSSWTTWRALDRLRMAGAVRVVGVAPRAVGSVRGAQKALYGLAPGEIATGDE